MTTRLMLVALAGGALLSLPASASATFVHVVAPGESLSSVAGADGLTVEALAMANGMPASAELIAGSQLVIPAQGEGSAMEGSAPVAAGGDGDDDSDDGAAVAQAPVSATAASGAYVVQPGDTLSAIAARAGTTVAQLAAANGLDPNAPLPSGSTLTLVSSGEESSPASASAATSQPVGEAAAGSPEGPPDPTPETVSPAQVESIAAAEGVPPSLASAIADMESGFNNGLVSSAGARGVMQITPGTWNWISQSLAGPPALAPQSALENVRAGTLLLHSLLQSTGGNQSLAVAGYYQGLPSVLENGMYPSTQQYVSDVEALHQQFGGG